MQTYDRFLSRSGRVMRESAIRRMGSAGGMPGMISLAPGYPDPELFPWEPLRAIADRLLASADGTALQYGATRGYRPLLETLPEILRARQIAASPDHLLVTTGSQQGLDLVSRVLIDPGDVVLVELPSYVGALAAFRNALADLVGVPQEADGIDIAALEETIARLRREGRRPRLIYVVPNFQNPTGLLIGQTKRAALLDVVERHDLLLVEDDPYGDLYFEEAGSGPDRAVPIKARDASGRVIYLSSFSKILAPGFRAAWMVAPEPLIKRFDVAKQAMDICTGVLDQRIVLEAWREGIIASALPRLRACYGAKQRVLTGALERELAGFASWTRPAGGFFVWLTLTGGLDAEALLPRCVEARVTYVIGRAFFADDSGADTLRLSFSANTPSNLTEAVARLAAVVKSAAADLSAG